MTNSERWMLRTIFAYVLSDTLAQAVKLFLLWASAR